MIGLQLSGSISEEEIDGGIIVAVAVIIISLVCSNCNPSAGELRLWVWYLRWWP